MANEDLTRLRIDRDAAPAAPRRRRYRWWWLAALAAAAAVFWTVSRNAALPVDVSAVSQAYPSQAYTLLNATGYVVAQRKAAVASKATGRLEWLNVREGSQVRAGEVLARLESSDVTAQMKQAAAGVDVARANLEQGEAELKDAGRALERSRELLAKKFVSPAAHDAVVARHDKAKAAISGFKASIAVAQANLRAAQVAVEQTLIRAPFDGVVLTKNANVGDVITPFSSALGSQAAVVTMADMSTLEVEADVSEANLAKVSVGQHSEIQLDALPGERFRGMVHRTVPTVDRAKATVLVKIRFVDTDPRILPEMSAKVAFLGKEVPEAERAARTVVQPAAVVERDGTSVLFTVKDGRAQQVVVKKGMVIGELLEVSGVAAGDRVILRPPEKLRDGAAVTAK
ncbi:MAG: efflux RND transporter periplasmic adaptor subunit [Burkholderiales bacterium]|nr:efflux RND transporter periplasmic adaptor subunit [Burkholderiales bacterium]